MASGSAKATVTEVIVENNFRIIKRGKLVDMTYLAPTGITADGKYLPQGIKPVYSILFTGKANYENTDYWDWGFFINANGLLTARSRNNNASVDASWIHAHVCFIAK